MLAAALWFIATDADDAGVKAASGWPAVARRARPPGAFKDWTEAAQAGMNLRRWWSERLGGTEAPDLFTLPELPLNAGDRPETIPALTTEEAGPIEAASRQGEVSDRSDAQLPVAAVFTVVNVPLMFVPSDVMIPMRRPGSVQA